MANIPVAEIFGPTIQGEGPDVGKRTLFVRVVGCDFNCNWCFGIMPSKFRVPRIIKSNSKIKSLKSISVNTSGEAITNVKIGDKILTYDENMTLVETQVKDIIKRKAKCLIIKIKSKSYLVTPEHPFFTERGLVQAKDLTSYDKIILLSDWDLGLLFQSFEGEYNSIIQSNLINMSDVAKKLKPYYEHMFSIDKMKFHSNTGKRNGQYREDSVHSPHRDWLRDQINKGSISRCSVTGELIDKPSNLIVHHINEDDTDDSFDNLIVVSRRIHDIHHKRGFNFRSDNTKNKLINYTHISSIQEYDKEVDVINLRCEPYNSYFADGMWVHNCDSKFAWSRNEGTTDYTPDMLYTIIANKCVETKCCNVILTGGNPCLYDFSDFISAMNATNIKVGVETQGSIIPEWLGNCNTVVFSPKAPSSGQKDTYNNIVKYITEGNYRSNQMIAIKIPVFNDEDIDFARKYSKFVNDYIKVYTNSNLRFYLSIGNTDVKAQEIKDVRDRVLTDYEKIIDKINENPEDFQNTYILPQVHTLVWGNKQGV